MKRIVNIFSIILVGIALTTLTGCMKESLVEEKATTGDISKDDEYRIITVRWADWGENYHTGFPDQTAEEAGIKINWETIMNVDWGDKKAILLAGGDMPDAFMGSICLSESEIIENTEVFLPLEDYIDDYMPNLKKIMEEDPQMKALAYSSDGHIYGLPSKKPCRPIIANQMFINKTWLDNLGLSMPQTYEEFEKVLIAFKEQDANGNGDPNDEIPYGIGYADPVMLFTLPFGTTIGADNTYNLAMIDGKPEYLPISENYKNGVIWMHECYEKGLIDPELFTQDDSMKEAKLMAETPIIGCAAGWTPDATFGINADQYVALPALEGPDGNRYISSDPGHWNYSRYEFVVSSKCKNPGSLLSWADSFYTEDATIQNFYGSFGIGTRKNEDGTYTVLAPTTGDSADTFAWINSFRDFGPKYAPDTFSDKVIFEGENGDKNKLDLDKELSQYAREAFPNVSYTQEQLDRLTILYIDINNYVSINQANWVTEGGIEAQWDAYIKQLNDMGLADFMKIQQEAYENYMANR